MVADSWQTKAAKEAKAAAIADGLIPLHTDEVKLITRMYEATMRNKDAVKLLEQAVFQSTIKTQIAGIDLMCRPDIWTHEDDDTAVDCDIKSTDDMDRFNSQFFDLGYHRAAVFYGLLFDRYHASKQLAVQTKRKFLVCDKQEWPVCKVIHSIPEEALLKARAKILGTDTQEGALPALIKCLKSGIFPKPEETLELKVPSWA